MLEGLDETELEAYLDENSRIILLFEIEVLETVNEYVASATQGKEDYEPDSESLRELSKARDAFD